VALTAMTTTSGIAGLTNIIYGITTPIGFLRLHVDDLPAASYERIRWDDGVERKHTATPGVEWDETLRSTAPGAGGCGWETFSIETTHDASRWRPAGTTPDGLRVHVPVDGGNALAKQVRALQEEGSWAYADGDPGYIQGAAAGYLYPSDEAFLTANALYAVQRPDGEWILGLRSDAGSVVGECE
jgi:hypothetical protein